MNFCTLNAVTDCEQKSDVTEYVTSCTPNKVAKKYDFTKN